MLCLWGAPAASAQSDSSPPQSSVRGENFSAKPAPALFQSDCTGGGCHKGPQGLAKNQSQSGLASFLREHYTNSRESAAALSNYLVRLPAGPAPPEPRAARTTSPRGGPSPGGATDGPSWFGPDPAPGPNEARTPRQQQQQQGTRPPARAAARSGDDAAPAAAPPAAATPAAEPARPQPTPRAQRGRQQPTAAAAAPPAPEAAPPPPPPAPPQFDIFD